MGRKATVLIDGKTIREISDETGIREATIRTRMFPGCTIEDITECRAASILIDGMTLTEIATATGISKNTLFWRYKHGRTDYEALTVGRYGLRITQK